MTHICNFKPKEKPKPIKFYALQNVNGSITVLNREDFHVEHADEPLTYYIIQKNGNNRIVKVRMYGVDDKIDLDDVRETADEIKIILQKLMHQLST
jgi:hypothetical protein